MCIIVRNANTYNIVKKSNFRRENVKKDDLLY
jgi:hypothetical protein